MLYRRRNARKQRTKLKGTEEWYLQPLRRALVSLTLVAFGVSFALLLVKFEYEPQMDSLTDTVLRDFVDNFNVSNESAIATNSCHVRFHNPQMYLCHIIPWGANFGDELGPAVTKEVLRKKYPNCGGVDDLPVLDLSKREKYNHFLPEICLFTVGSVFFLVRDNDHLWGTGSIDGQRQICQNEAKNLTVYSVRGPKTANLVKRWCRDKLHTPFRGISGISQELGFGTTGDPGFLVAHLFENEFKYDSAAAPLDYCVIPHYFNRKINDLKSVPKEQILSVQQSWQSMIKKMLRCKFIISSSLHGVILSESFGIPVRWLSRNNRVAPFKFHDYFESFGYRNATEIGSVSTVEEGVAMGPPAVLTEAVRQEQVSRILQTFPYALFTVAGSDATS
ncbi:predicted protein [Phaeodactylum tricornutum CCAP 1055/1]|jgi:pyruvyltransferase|uniref:Polysaccharide pyruvyl transferase domain-containing protein n=2 Tax=Phaeodactylum tricornutum TaxID=2850 RepID=B7G2P7_PHATC|nr:predicted protein [Phaeodactylum tricornutum CCAP 1055/1]EEC47341.1 predicted protein [Phaeodactylum tricornutum CCAP 1055/1]|eukprot:XP_002181418.1 predicted protein [Phaeodactylum tricornutum CCAP 1055/1]